MRARRELGSNPTETLKLTEQHARLFPTGTLVPEREVLAIEALAQLGRLSEARARLADFRARFPESPHLARLEATLGR